jgi:hypothetical protein
MENRLSFRGMSNAYNYGIWLAGFNGTATTSRFCRSKTESTSIEDVPAWVSSCRGWKAELQTLQGTRIVRYLRCLYSCMSRLRRPVRWPCKLHLVISRAVGCSPEPIVWKSGCRKFHCKGNELRSSYHSHPGDGPASPM